MDVKYFEPWAAGLVEQEIGAKDHLAVLGPGGARPGVAFRFGNFGENAATEHLFGGDTEDFSQDVGNRFDTAEFRELGGLGEETLVEDRLAVD